MSIAPDLKSLLPVHVANQMNDDRPVYYLWTYEPPLDHTEGNGKVYMDHNEDKHPAHHMTHDELAPQVTHPDKVHGYAYSIEGGWRITDDDHKEVDPFIVRQILKALRSRHPEKPLPNVS